MSDPSSSINKSANDDPVEITTTMGSTQLPGWLVNDIAAAGLTEGIKYINQEIKNKISKGCFATDLNELETQLSKLKQKYTEVTGISWDYQQKKQKYYAKQAYPITNIPPSSPPSLPTPTNGSSKRMLTSDFEHSGLNYYRDSLESKEFVEWWKKHRQYLLERTTNEDFPKSYRYYDQSQDEVLVEKKKQNQFIQFLLKNPSAVSYQSELPKPTIPLPIWDDVSPCLFSISEKTWIQFANQLENTLKDLNIIHYFNPKTSTWICFHVAQKSILNPKDQSDVPQKIVTRFNIQIRIPNHKMEAKKSGTGLLFMMVDYTCDHLIWDEIKGFQNLPEGMSRIFTETVIFDSIVERLKPPECSGNINHSPSNSSFPTPPPPSPSSPIISPPPPSLQLSKIYQKVHRDRVSENTPNINHLQKLTQSKMIIPDSLFNTRQIFTLFPLRKLYSILHFIMGSRPSIDWMIDYNIMIEMESMLLGMTFMSFCIIPILCLVSYLYPYTTKFTIYLCMAITVFINVKTYRWCKVKLH